MVIFSVRGRHILLRPLLEQDINLIFQWRCDLSDLHLWYQRPEVLSSREFVDDFESFVSHHCHVLQMILPLSSQVPIGMAYSYKADYLNGHAFVCTYVDLEHRNYLYGAEASLLFTDYLFSYFPFRKIYAEVYEHNSASRSNLVKGGWIQEGRLKNHIWRLGEYKDMLIYALFRDSFYEKYSRLLEHISQTPERK